MSTSAEYKYDGGDLKVTDQMKQDFAQYGYIMMRNLLDKEELEKIKYALENNSAIFDHSFKVDDGEGGLARMVNWCHPGSDVTGMIGRCEKVAGTCEQLLGGEVYHYHSKLMMKDAETGGKHMWHQDYGYWYKNGNLFPDMMTVFIAVDKCMKENGCLQVSNNAIKECTNYTDMTGKDFLDPATSTTMKYKGKK